MSSEDLKSNQIERMQGPPMSLINSVVMNYQKTSKIDSTVLRKSFSETKDKRFTKVIRSEIEMLRSKSVSSASPQQYE